MFIILNTPILRSLSYSNNKRQSEVIINNMQITSKNLIKYLKSRMGLDILLNSFLAILLISSLVRASSFISFEFSIIK